MYLETTMICLDLSRAAERTCATFDVGARTDRGRVRENNEDSLFTDLEMGLFVLSDGMGGLARGEVASQMTVRTIAEHLRHTERAQGDALGGSCEQGLSAESKRLISAIHLANEAVYRAARESAMPGEMGATVVAVRCQDRAMSIAHVGDSRGYLLRKKDLVQLTEDHSLAAEQARLAGSAEAQAIAGAYQNLLTRAVGIEMQVAVDVTEERMQEGDTLLLCSDGLTRELSDTQIAAILCNSRTAQAAADQLVDLALEAGGGDNVSVVVVRPGAAGGLSASGRLRRWLQFRS